MEGSLLRLCSMDSSGVNTSSSNPLYTDRIMIRAAVPMAMPMALIAEIMLITLCDFFANRYLPAMNQGKFTVIQVCRNPSRP